MEWNDVFKCLVLLFFNLIALCGFTILMVTLYGVKIGIIFSIMQNRSFKHPKAVT